MGFKGFEGSKGSKGSRGSKGGGTAHHHLEAPRSFRIYDIRKR